MHRAVRNTSELKNKERERVVAATKREAFAAANTLKSHVHAVYVDTSFTCGDGKTSLPAPKMAYHMQYW